MIYETKHQYNNQSTSENLSNKLEIDIIKPYNKTIQPPEDIFLQIDKIILQHPKRITKQERPSTNTTSTTKNKSNNINRRNPTQTIEKKHNSNSHQKSVKLKCSRHRRN